MKLLITGAAGFLGRYLVAEALRRGHDVRAMIRPGRLAACPWSAHPRLSLVEHDLEQRSGLAAQLAGIDAVIHLAAKANTAATLAATEPLLEAMGEAGSGLLVAIGSLAVYDYQGLRDDTVLDESTPLESHPEGRDAYARAKLEQEQLVRERATARGLSWTVLRPGAIYGKDHLWTARLGQSVGSKLWLRIGRSARLPLTYVENCVEALVLAAENRQPSGQVFNVIDDDQPSQGEYASLVRSRLRPRPWVVVVPGPLARGLAVLGGGADRLVFGGSGRLPGLLLPARFDARFKPLRYSNERIKAVLGWRPRYSLEEALQRVLRPEAELLSVPAASSPAVTLGSAGP